MLRVGLTGGIASGKSTVSTLFREFGASVIDADDLARQVVEPGQPAFVEIVARFGEAMLGDDGCLDRAALGAIVFKDAAARTDLEAMTHPRIVQEALRWFLDIERRGELLAFFEVPLLFEVGLEGLFDRVVLVAAKDEIQLARVAARDGLTGAEASARLESQMATDEKVRRAHHVIWNEGTIDELRETVRKIYAELVRCEGRGSR